MGVGRMEFHYLTLDDFQLRDKRVLLRLDINAPLDPSSNQILDDGRFVSAKPTLDALASARVAILSHQSRPGRGDFTSLQQHASILQNICTQRVGFVEDVMGPTATAGHKGSKKRRCPGLRQRSLLLGGEFRGYWREACENKSC